MFMCIRLLAADSPIKLPITLTAIHMGISSLCAHLAISMFPHLFPSQTLKTKAQSRGLVVISGAVATSVTTGVACLKYIPISLDQSIGATTSAWVALLVFLYLRKVETLPVYCCLGVAVLGSLVTGKADPQFHLVGFSLSLVSTITRALKGLMQQKLMSTDQEKLSPMNLLKYQGRVAACMLLPLAALLEDPGAIPRVLTAKFFSGDFWWIFMFISNCFLAFLTNITQTWMTKVTSALTAQIMGVLKSVLLVLTSVMIFGNPVPPVALAGYITTFVAVATYTYLKNQPQHTTRDRKVHGGGEKQADGA